jgi:hypothetical protein
MGGKIGNLQEIPRRECLFSAGLDARITADVLRGSLAAPSILSAIVEIAQHVLYGP